MSVSSRICEYFHLLLSANILGGAGWGEASKMIATILSNLCLQVSFKVCVCMFDVFLRVLQFAPDTMLYLLKMTSQTWLQIMYIPLGGPVKSFKILTYEIKLFFKMLLL